VKQTYLIYIFIGLTVLFLGLVGFLVWKDKPTLETPSVTNSNIDKPKKEPVYPKIDNYEVPILMYHYIRVAPVGDTLGQNLSVTPINFASQMKWLKENNYATLNLADLADLNKKAISKIIYDKKKPIIITFDDGYEDAYTSAWPILKENDFNGTFFIIRNFVGRSEYMNQNQINVLSNAGMEIGSHTLSHPSLEKLSTADQRTQIFDSKNTAKTFCYPSGKYNDISIVLLKEAGYLAAVTTQPGIANQDSNLFELPRVRIENGDGEYLKNKLIP